MKIDRLIGILSILLQEEKTTAPELAERFEVSRRTILTSKDLQMILAGLRSLDSVSGSSYYGQLMEKIQTGSSEFISGRNSMRIDLSSWYKRSLAPKIEVIQRAIDDEPATVEAMHRFMEEQGYVLDITDQRYHHEIYLVNCGEISADKYI